MSPRKKIKMMISSLSRAINRSKVTALFATRHLGLFELYQPLPWLGIDVDSEASKRHRTIERWHMIERELPEKPCSVLDIGSNVGFFSFKLAEKGNFVIAMERSLLFHEIANAAMKAINFTNVNFYRIGLTPQNVRTLPRCDVVLLLSVFHQWCLEFGEQQALDMLRCIADKADQKFFFETGQPDAASARYLKALPKMREPKEWLLTLFQSMGFNVVNIIGKTRGRYLVMAKR